MKYYIYRSAPKIDMLWEQLDAKAVEKYSAELSINLGLVSGGIKSQPTEKNLHARLEIVLKNLQDERTVGGLDSPSAFVAGELPMTWQELEFYGKSSAQRMVLFSGFDPVAKILVGLVGSAAHVTGMNDTESASLGYAQPAFWNRIIDELTTPDEEELKENLYDLDNMIDYQARRRDDGPPKQSLEFVAKTYLATDNFIVGSPLYVAESVKAGQ